MANPDGPERPQRVSRRARTCKALVMASAACLLGASAPDTGLPHFAPWIDGTSPDEPETQVQMIDADTAVIRQSVRTNFEAPFLYLLFGRDRALLLDTGAGGLRIRPPIERVIDAWRARHGGRTIHLVVAHTHGHGDHHAGDEEFRDRPDTELVGLAPAQVVAFFHLADWPNAVGTYDLGRRVLDVIPTPGHEPSHIMIYDRRTRLLLSGDMLYPGRLYMPIDQFGVFQASARRVSAFAATHPIRAVLGAHIEMSDQPGQDYPMRAATHPMEHPLPLSPALIDELQLAVSAAASPPVIDRHADFIVYPRPARPAPPALPAHP
ncbi:MBL fold metallo-hydrolase [Sphingomonas bacterium]|uniref:MBL fold metallo-hydrolase n=1 Tax=Sphingomonas bacterium TaxID=1895847 RepID=UPI001575EFD4|nr:MBL fold metallo-hydrolase [Sphingomonas bacterium]